MTSAEIRWIIAGLFLAFLAYVVLSDVLKRHRRPTPRARGFRSRRVDRSHSHQGWKTPRRH